MIKLFEEFIVQLNLEEDQQTRVNNLISDFYDKSKI